MEWVNVKDRLPEDSQNIIFYLSSANDVMSGYYDALLKEFTILNGEWGWSTADISHWMPLPEPPEDETNSEFDRYEVYYSDELIAEVKDYRKGFDSVIYGLSTDTRVVKK
jgi:hypothetical protein